MIFRLTGADSRAEAYAEEIAAELLADLQDCPYCHHAATLYTRKERVERTTIMRGFCANCGRKSTGLELLCKLRGQTRSDMIHELTPSSCYTGGASTTARAVDLCVEELHGQISELLEQAEREEHTTADAVEELLELREIERGLSLIGEERHDPCAAWHRYAERAAELLELERRRGGHDT